MVPLDGELPVGDAELPGTLRPERQGLRRLDGRAEGVKPRPVRHNRLLIICQNSWKIPN